MRQTDRRIDMTRTATLCAIIASVSLSAQTTPPPTPSISISGCVAQVQRDGSLGAKATGTQATPETAATEANSPEPTGRYQLVDATPIGGDRQQADAPAGTKPAQRARTSYALRGQEGSHLQTHQWTRVWATSLASCCRALSCERRIRLQAGRVRAPSVPAGGRRICLSR